VSRVHQPGNEKDNITYLPDFQYVKEMSSFTEKEEIAK
jgi:hypothetical protein